MWRIWEGEFKDLEGSRKGFAEALPRGKVEVRLSRTERNFAL